MNWDTQRDVVAPIIRRNVELERDNANLRAKVEELEGELRRTQAAAIECANECGIQRDRATRAEAELAEAKNYVPLEMARLEAERDMWKAQSEKNQRDTECAAGRLLQAEAELAKAREELSGYSLAICYETGCVNCAKAIDARHDAEAELATCAKDRDEWMRECLKAQGQRDEARGRCEKLWEAADDYRTAVVLGALNVTDFQRRLEDALAECVEG